MKKAQRVLIFLLLLIFVYNFCSCRKSIDEIEQRFAQYKADNNVVAVLDDSVFYFYDHTLHLKDIANDEEPNKGYLFLQNKLFFSTSKKNAMFDYTFCVYECDIYGNNKKMIFEKSGYKTHPWATANNGLFYLEYYESNAMDKSSRKIDSYDVIKGAYENVSIGEDVSLSDYKKASNGKYTFNYEKDVLTITDTQTESKYKIDNNTLCESDFGESLIGLDCAFFDHKATNDGRIYLVYRIKFNGPPYPYIICEYIPDIGEVVFKSFFSASDVQYIKVENVR